jgi:ATP-dependent DNA helicase RecQ
MLRRRLAQERAVPAYIVFGDAALRDMARRRPSNAGSFLGVSGVGLKKLEQYGETILQAIHEYCQAHSLKMDVL